MSYIYGNEGVTTQPISGKMYNETFPVGYMGISTDTAEVIVNNREHTIAVNVNKNEVNKSGVYHQERPSKVWTINHKLDRFPTITCFNDENELVVGEVSYKSPQLMEVKFSEAIAGHAFLN